MPSPYCEKCGTTLSATARYCANCGADLRQTERHLPATGGTARPGLKYRLLWILLAALSATLLLFSLVRLGWQIQSGSFPRPGALWSSLLFAALAGALFYAERAIVCRLAGLGKGEKRWSGSRHTGLESDGTIGQPRGIFNFLFARPVILLLAVLTCATVLTGFLTRPETKQNGTANDQTNLPQASASEPTGMVQDRQVVRLNGIWWKWDKELPDTIHFLRLTEESAVTGTCSSFEELDIYAQDGIVNSSMVIADPSPYDVLEAAFLEVRNSGEDYLCGAVIELNGTNGSAASTWNLDFMQTLSRDDPQGTGDYYLRTDHLCTYSFMSGGEETTILVPPEPDENWGVWVLDTEYETYKALESHQRADIPFVYFSRDGTMYLGTCTGAAEIFRFVMGLPVIPDETSALECSFSSEDAVYALHPDLLIPRIDSGRIFVTLKPDSDPIIWEMKEGGLLQMENGDLYRWGEGSEFRAMN